MTYSTATLRAQRLVADGRLVVAHMFERVGVEGCPPSSVDSLARSADWWATWCKLRLRQ